MTLISINLSLTNVTGQLKVYKHKRKIMAFLFQQSGFSGHGRHSWVDQPRWRL